MWFRFMLLWLVSNQVNGQHTLDSNLEQSTQVASEVTAVSKLLKQFLKQHTYETLLLENCATLPEMQTDILTNTKAPTVIANNGTQLFWRMRYNKLLLTFCCAESESKGLLALKGLADKLQHIRYNRVLLYVNLTSLAPQLETLLKRYFKYCVTLQMLNVVAVLQDFRQTQTIYGFENFPKFRLTTEHYTPLHDYFRDKVSNLRGDPIFTLPDQIDPRSLLYRDKTGALQLSGYIGKLMLTFASHLNASLRFPYPVVIGQSIYVRDLQNYTRAGIIDIATGLGGPKALLNTEDYTIPVEFARWMPMMPVEEYLHVHEMYLLIFRSDLVLCLAVLAVLFSILLTLFRYQYVRHDASFWLDLLLNDQSLRGVLSQPFPTAATQNFKITCLFVMIFISGLVITPLYSAYLNALLAQPPTQPRIDTFDDLLHSKLKILMAREELGPLKLDRGEEFWSRYQRGFHIIDSYAEYMQLSRSLNKTYAYAITSDLWPLIAQQQEFFQRKLFRLSPEMYFQQRIAFCLPLNENSIYKNKLNDFLNNVHQAGLMSYWRMWTFFDMVTNGTMSFTDLSTARHYEAMTLGDLYWIWLIYGVSVFASVLAFLMELLAFKLSAERRFNNK